MLDSAGGQASKEGSELKTRARLMKVALKAAKVCIECGEFNVATKVLERAAEYQEVLTKGQNEEQGEEEEIGERLRVEYFAVRALLVSAAARTLDLIMSNT